MVEHGLNNMKTWFSKEEQKWVSNIPKAFWLGVYDVYTKEKLYSNDILYNVSEATLRICGMPYNEKPYNYREDCSKCRFGYNEIPYTWLDPKEKYTKYPEHFEKKNLKNTRGYVVLISDKM